MLHGTRHLPSCPTEFLSSLADESMSTQLELCLAGSGKLTSKKGVMNFVTALLQGNVLYALSIIVTNVERTGMWISAGEVSLAHLMLLPRSCSHPLRDHCCCLQ